MLHKQQYTPQLQDQQLGAIYTSTSALPASPVLVPAPILDVNAQATTTPSPSLRVAKKRRARGLLKKEVEIPAQSKLLKAIELNAD
ncbi:hypothetical protein G6F42_019435 [Rhizopus arrhizus]|nr:hypothetical protein G6F42_019435 [Rhizopus arrhizus]